jgi:hypothetical protein
MQLQDEEFYQISLDVRGKRTLAESLDSYVSKELMDGQNQYLCEQLGKKVGGQGKAGLDAQAQGPDMRVEAWGRWGRRCKSGWQVAVFHQCGWCLSLPHSALPTQHWSLSTAHLPARLPGCLLACCSPAGGR